MIKGEVVKKVLVILALALSANVWAEEIRLSYYPEGQLSSEATYVNDKMNGPYKDYHKNGNIESIGQYLNDKLSGPWQFFAKDGTLVEEGNFVKGKEEGNWKYYSKSQQQGGNLFEIVQYEDGLENGIAATFYPSGAVRCKTAYVDGVFEGTSQSFYANGQIRVQHTYKNGKLHGKGHAWSKEGQLIIQFNDVNGKEKKRAFYDGLNESEAWDLMDLSKAEGKRGSDNHNRWLVLWPCGEDGWTDEELFDD